jgi:hypothetical protein
MRLSAHLHYDVLLCNITDDLIHWRILTILEFLVMPRYTEGIESYALHNLLRRGSKPVDGREVSEGVYILARCSVGKCFG